MDDDALIAKAKAAVKAQVDDPDNASFQQVVMRVVGGKKMVCSFIVGKDAAGTATVPRPFAYDEPEVYLIFAGAISKKNGNLVGEILDAYLVRNTAAYDQLCK